ncbi:hypothetical protein [Streptomyces shenzhenensis]|uniref:hypothetical protein n=1 Tax=Streptomyces shenzhenensis TaxID=943815 RepID=UPI00217E4047|nr:hypothetical protein [Streptomyces shenzhenensis]
MTRWGHFRGLERVVDVPATVVDTVRLDELHADVRSLFQRARERDHGVVVEVVVAESDQVLVPAAVVPAQRQPAQDSAGFAHVEDRLEAVGGVLVPIVSVVAAA